MTSTTSEASLLDDAWLSAPPRRSRLRLALVVLLAAAVVFLAGVEVQKQYGAAVAAGVPPGVGAGARLGSGPPSGGGFPGTGTAASAAPSATASSATGSSAVIGTVTAINGDVWTVTDLGGTTHRITVGSTARVVRETELAAGAVATGSTVDVSGSADARGRVTATTITIR